MSILFTTRHLLIGAAPGGSRLVRILRLEAGESGERMDRVRIWRSIVRLFTVRTRLEACALIWAVAVGAVARGSEYLAQYPGWAGYLLFSLVVASVFVAGGLIFEAQRARLRSTKQTEAVGIIDPILELAGRKRQANASRPHSGWPGPRHGRSRSEHIS